MKRETLGYFWIENYDRKKKSVGKITRHQKNYDGKRTSLVQKNP